MDEKEIEAEVWKLEAEFQALEAKMKAEVAAAAGDRQKMLDAVAAHKAGLRVIQARLDEMRQ